MTQPSPVGLLRTSPPLLQGGCVAASLAGVLHVFSTCARLATPTEGRGVYGEPSVGSPTKNHGLQCGLSNSRAGASVCRGLTGGTGVGVALTRGPEAGTKLSLIFVVTFLNNGGTDGVPQSGKD